MSWVGFLSQYASESETVREDTFGMELLSVDSQHESLSSPRAASSLPDARSARSESKPEFAFLLGLALSGHSGFAVAALGSFPLALGA